ncbi:MAG: hypothetical protein K2K70_09805 [Lachnospiraceae bacterium]|nr:hypothetical protein [Lachnospiraceae bacterium]
MPLDIRIRCYLVGYSEEDGDIVGGVITHFGYGSDGVSSFQQKDLYSVGITFGSRSVLPWQIDDCGIVPAVISQTAMQMSMQ